MGGPVASTATLLLWQYPPNRSMDSSEELNGTDPRNKHILFPSIVVVSSFYSPPLSAPPRPGGRPCGLLGQVLFLLFCSPSPVDGFPT